jgi:hypothetical protein
VPNNLGTTRPVLRCIIPLALLSDKICNVFSHTTIIFFEQAKVSDSDLHVFLSFLWSLNAQASFQNRPEIRFWSASVVSFYYNRLSSPQAKTVVIPWTLRKAGQAKTYAGSYGGNHNKNQAGHITQTR